MDRSLDLEAVPRVAAKQGGVFTMAQARSEGWTHRQIRRRLAAGRWQYVAGWALARANEQEQPWTGFQLSVAAQLTIPSLVRSHWTAGELHGFPLEPCAVKALSHVTAPTWRQSQRNLRIHCLRLDESEIELHASGLRITTKPGTALDLLSTLALPEALDLWAWVSSRGILDPEALEAATAWWERWHGRPQLRQLLELVGDGAVSGAEFILHRLLREAGIEGWTAGVTITDQQGVIGLVDVHFDGTRVVVEVDGFRSHSSKRSFVNDRRRQNRLIMAGHNVLRYTWDDLRDRPAEVIAEIQAALRGHALVYPAI
jgi:very-short-patch-repair endonuclease